MKKLETLLSITFIAFTLTTAFITGQVSRQPEINKLIDEAARLRTIPPASGIALRIPCPIGAEDVALDTVDCERHTLGKEATEMKDNLIHTNFANKQVKPTPRSHLLVGIDCEGESREMWTDSTESAKRLGDESMTGDHPWQSYAVWANAPEWQVVYGSPCTTDSDCEEKNGGEY